MYQMLIRMLTFSLAKVGACSSDKRISDKKTQRGVAVAAPISPSFGSKVMLLSTLKSCFLLEYYYATWGILVYIVERCVTFTILSYCLKYMLNLQCTSYTANTPLILYFLCDKTVTRFTKLPHCTGSEM